MNKESKSGFAGLSGNGTVALVALVAGSLYFRSVPLETTRPPASEASVPQRAEAQRVDARLWQDPFAAVARALEPLAQKASQPGSSESADIAIKPLRDEISQRLDAGKHVEVLAVMLSGGPYAEDTENRRRTRYAVLAALNTSRFEPADSKQLKYFVVADAAAKLPRVVPYEWFDVSPDTRQRKDATDKRSVLLMWLNAEAFAHQPFDRWNRLAAALQPLPGHSIDWRILGPPASDGLRVMVDEAADPKNLPEHPSGVTMRFYSPTATVPDTVLLERKPLNGLATDLSGYFKDRNIHFVRTIGDDEQLADGLIEELQRRGLKAMALNVPAGSTEREARRELCGAGNADAGSTEGDGQPSPVAVVAEWDTLYGRSLRRDFRASEGRAGFCVERFVYLRGLDGLLPVKAKAGSDVAEPGKTAAANDKLDLRRNDGTSIERAEGQSQFDYLRRLAAQVRARDAELRRTRADGRGIRAIGVLGNDVHDKLLVMKALQPEFPNAIFFTTDLDQRLIHPREQPWTRNLLVASNFGLQLFDGLQAGTPPFRDGYQTSLFLSARLALDDARRTLLKGEGNGGNHGDASRGQDKIDPWFAKPRIFEIGRTGAFDFSESRFTRAEREARIATCRGADWVECRNVHPPGSPMVPTFKTTALFVVFNILILGLWLPALALSRSTRRRLYRALSRTPRRPSRVGRWSALVGVLVLVHVALPAALAGLWPAFADWLTRDGKPLVAFEGISLWPTEGIRLVTTLLCVYLMCRGWVALERNIDDIARRLRLETTRDKLIKEQLAADRTLTRFERLKQMFSFKFAQPRSQRHSHCDAMNPGTVAFWKRYIVQNRLTARLTRTFTFAFLAWLAGYIVTLVLDEAIQTPHRGELSLRVHQWLSVPAHVTIYVLSFFVVDATVFCVFFVRGLRVRGANWPGSTLRAFEQELDMPRCRHLDNWIDLQFVALRTQVVGRLIYYPFIVLSLLLVSRSPTFDDWHTPVGGLFLAANCGAIALSCAMALRIMAERSRRHALEALDDSILCAAGSGTREPHPTPRVWMSEREQAPEPPRSPTLKQLELLRERVEGLRDGAFAPFSQQPLLKALLLPFATFGGTTLLDYMALANL